jgi:transposase
VSVTPEVEAEIRRLHFGEHWPVGTIATQLAHHTDVVKRVLGLLEARANSPLRPRAVDAYGDFILETLTRYPTLRATRLYDMLKLRGFTGSVRTLREHVAVVRPKPRREAYLRLETLMGEQAQVDWAYVTKVRVPGGERPLWLFVMVLSWSRAAWGEFVFDTTVHSLRRSLRRAAAYFGGCTRQWLFDNPKTVVLERHGDAARFHPLLLELSGAYCASLRLCAPRRGNEKGKVERAIRFWRERFLAGREVHSIEQGNRELLTFLDEVANARPHPVQAGKTVAQCLAEEKHRLLPLPKAPPSTDVVEPVTVDKTAFVRFDTNSYSVHPDDAEQTLTLVADDVTVRVLRSDGEEVARHARNWGRRQRIEEPAHRQALLETKRGARETKGQDRLRAAVPGIDKLFERWVDAGRNVGSLTSRTVLLLDIYGEDIVRQAVLEVLAGSTHDHHAVAVICERLRRKTDKPVPLDVPLGTHVQDRDVIPHSLESYDVRAKRRP